MAGILLAQNNSKIIGVVVNDHEKYEGHLLEDAFVASSLNALSTEIEQCGQFMMVKKTTSPEEIIRFASMWNVDKERYEGFCAGFGKDVVDFMMVPVQKEEAHAGVGRRQKRSRFVSCAQICSFIFAMGYALNL